MKGLDQNHSHFLDRIITMAAGRDSGVSTIKPAITPDNLPETYPHLLEKKKEIEVERYRLAQQSSSSSLSQFSPFFYNPQEGSSHSSDSDLHLSGMENNMSHPKDFGNNDSGSMPIEDNNRQSEINVDQFDRNKGDDKLKTKFSKKSIVDQIEELEKDLPSAQQQRRQQQDPLKNIISSLFEEVNKLNKKKQRYPETIYEHNIPALIKELRETVSREEISVKKYTDRATAIAAATLKESMETMQQQQQQQQQDTDPTVTINIGRIDVRAMLPEKLLPSSRMLEQRHQQQFPPLSLKDYLKQRSETRR
jgi:hypothetical protein